MHKTNLKFKNAYGKINKGLFKNN